MEKLHIGVCVQLCRAEPVNIIQHNFHLQLRKNSRVVACTSTLTVPFYFSSNFTREQGTFVKILEMSKMMKNAWSWTIVQGYFCVKFQAFSIFAELKLLS